MRARIVTKKIKRNPYTLKLRNELNRLREEGHELDRNIQLHRMLLNMKMYDDSFSIDDAEKRLDEILEQWHMVYTELETYCCTYMHMKTREFYKFK